MGNRARPTVLFTAFEPSGDGHAAGIVAELSRRRPDLEMAAWGGPKMAQAGASLEGHTADDGAMGLGGLTRARLLFRERKRIEQWLQSRKLLMHVGVDSPSANIRIAPVTRAAGGQYVQFVAPQFWAWAPWRLRKFRRLASQALCILPFEEAWFRDRHMSARYVGHPVLSRELDPAHVQAARARASLPEGEPRIVLLPGSRRSEIVGNMELLLRAFQDLQRRHQGTAGVVIAAKEDLVGLIEESMRPALADAPPGKTPQVQVGNLEGYLDWADLALNVSGTVSLDLARQHVPMVAVYKMGFISWFGSKFVISTPDRLLPNIIAGRRIVPEFIPHIDGPTPIADAADRLLQDPARMTQTRQDLAEVIAQFGRKDAAIEAVDAIEQLLDRSE